MAVRTFCEIDFQARILLLLCVPSLVYRMNVWKACFDMMSDWWYWYGILVEAWQHTETEDALSWEMELMHF